MVRNLTNFGVFVELEQGVDGLVHISDLSWTKKIRHPGEMVKKGDEIEVVILGVDVDQRRISLGHKQIDDNPWEKFGENYRVGTEVDGKIVRIIEKGVIVELPLGVDGFVPISQLSMGQIKNIADKFHVGDDLPLKVLEFDKDCKEDRPFGRRVPEGEGRQGAAGLHGRAQIADTHRRRPCDDHGSDTIGRYLNPEGKLTSAGVIIGG